MFCNSVKPDHNRILIRAVAFSLSFKAFIWLSIFSPIFFANSKSNVWNCKAVYDVWMRCNNRKCQYAFTDSSSFLHLPCSCSLIPWIASSKCEASCQFAVVEAYAIFAYNHKINARMTVKSVDVWSRCSSLFYLLNVEETGQERVRLLRPYGCMQPAEFIGLKGLSSLRFTLPPLDGRVRIVYIPYYFRLWSFIPSSIHSNGDEILCSNNIPCFWIRLLIKHPNGPLELLTKHSTV